MARQQRLDVVDEMQRLLVVEVLDHHTHHLSLSAGFHRDRCLTIANGPHVTLAADAHHVSRHGAVFAFTGQIARLFADLRYNQLPSVVQAEQIKCSRLGVKPLRKKR